MKTGKKIFIAFILNLLFSIFELIGGIFTGSIAIFSDAVHDFGDAASIGVSYLFEKKSNRRPDKVYTYGYARYSVLGGAITTIALMIASVVVVCNAVYRCFHPVTIDGNGMLILACVGLVVNGLATYFTHGGRSINQKAVNLHMLEDVLGWVVILIGAVVIRFTNFYLLDPILSIFVAVFIFVGTCKNLKQILDIFLIKTPKGIRLDDVKTHLLRIKGIIDVHHIHVWTLDGERLLATLHIVVERYSVQIKKEVKRELREHGIVHSCVEVEEKSETCLEKECLVKHKKSCVCAHHHHHH